MTTSDEGPKRIHVTLSRELLHYIDVLMDRGIHGKTRPQIVERLVGNEIERLIRDGFLQIEDPTE